MRASRGVVLGSVLAATLLGSVGSAQAGDHGSSAKAAAQSPQSICGSGYYIQRQHTLPGAVAYQLYNGSSNCAVTVKTASVGTPTQTTAGLQVRAATGPTTPATTPTTRGR